MSVDIHEDYLAAADLEAATQRIMAEQGIGRHEAHIQACRELNLAEGDAGNVRPTTGTWGRVAGAVLALGLILLPGLAWAGDRGSFPDNRCPGSGCPDNAKQDQCNPKPECGGDETGIEVCCTAESDQGPAGG